MSPEVSAAIAGFIGTLSIVALAASRYYWPSGRNWSDDRKGRHAHDRDDDDDTPEDLRPQG